MVFKLRLLRVCFNSRTREGCDLSEDSLISSEQSFNSRTREGCDMQMLLLWLSLSSFQFTHPGGVRQFL